MISRFALKSSKVDIFKKGFNPNTCLSLSYPEEDMDKLSAELQQLQGNTARQE